MANLLISILAIALFSITMFAGSNYVNLDRMIVSNYKSEIKSDIYILNTRLSTYKNFFGYQAPITDWKTELAKTGRLQTSNAVANWSYNKNSSNEYYICYRDMSINKNTYHAIKAVGEDYNPAFMNSACGSDENTSVFINPTTFPADVSLTYWIN